ncbi:MAG TPA: hypothetical protein VHV08_09390 [Pirellulales bacterium]|nr:hypothetical protein [Pirellulales bacterium]
MPRRQRLPADAAERAYMSGIDEIPWQCRIQWSDGGLVVEREQHDSGNFFIPVLIDGHGELMLSTASLMERPRPYQLDVELARGTLHRLRNQIAVWEGAGMAIPAEVIRLLAAAREHFSWAATRQTEPEQAADRAAAALSLTLSAMDRLSLSYTEQVLPVRHQQAGKLTTLIGCHLGSAPPTAAGERIASAFNTAVVPLVWREIESREGRRDWTLADKQIEWCRSLGLKICSGPLLSIDKWSLPDWMYLWGEEDLDSFYTCVTEHLEATVTRYRGKVQLWQCAAGLNIKSDFLHDDEQRLRMAVLAVESIRRIDPRAPIVLCIDQPWGSFMGREDYELSPFHFVDALVRSDLGLAGIGLEINFGYLSPGSDPRDVLEFSRQLDRFSLLGLPLLVELTVPSGAGDDPRARSSAKAVNYSDAAALSPQAQRAWGEKFLPMLLTKQAVQGIIWNQLFDSKPHTFRHGGLFDEHDHPKPLFELLESLRREHLM